MAYGGLSGARGVRDRPERDAEVGGPLGGRVTKEVEALLREERGVERGDGGGPLVGPPPEQRANQLSCFARHLQPKCGC